MAVKIEAVPEAIEKAIERTMFELAALYKMREPHKPSEDRADWRTLGDTGEKDGRYLGMAVDYHEKSLEPHVVIEYEHPAARGDTLVTKISAVPIDSLKRDPAAVLKRAARQLMGSPPKVASKK